MDRNNFIEEKNKILEENYMLRVKVNDLGFENAKILKDFSYFKQEMDI